MTIRFMLSGIADLNLHEKMQAILIETICQSNLSINTNVTNIDSVNHFRDVLKPTLHVTVNGGKVSVLLATHD